MRKFILLALAIFLFVFVITSCKKDMKPRVLQVVTVTPRYSKEELDSLKVDVIHKGDKSNYSALRFALSQNNENELPYALIMANKYHYSFAYYEVYRSIIDLSEDSKIELDSITKSFALKYLMQAAKMKNGNALYELSSLYKEGKFFPKDSIKAEELLKEARHYTNF